MNAEELLEYAREKENKGDLLGAKETLIRIFDEHPESQECEIATTGLQRITKKLGKRAGSSFSIGWLLIISFLAGLGLKAFEQGVDIIIEWPIHLLGGAAIGFGIPIFAISIVVPIVVGGVYSLINKKTMPYRFFLALACVAVAVLVLGYGMYKAQHL